MRQNSYQSNFQEQQRLQSYFNNNRRYNQPLNDGFSISDGSQGTVVAVDGQSRADYDKMIKSNFKYTQDNYQEAYKDAARTGRPVVAIFGGFEHNNSRELIENSLPAAKSGAAKDAVYIYIDRAKIKDAELAKFADGQLAGGHNAAVSIVFSVKPDKNGGLQPEAETMRWQGGHHSMISSFNAAISAAKERQESYQGKFNPNALVDKSEKSDASDSSKNPDRAERGDKPIGSFAVTRDLITDEITTAVRTKDWHESERHYRAAMNAADKITPAEIKAEQDRIAKAIATTPQDSAEFKKLLQAQANLTFVKNAKSTIRADRGIACLEWSESQTDETLKQQFREIGGQWIKSAALRNPSLYENSELHKRLAATGIPAEEIQKLIPGLRPPRAANTEQDLFEYGGDGKTSNPPPERDETRAKEKAAKAKEEAESREAAEKKQAAEKREAAEKKVGKQETFKNIEEEDLGKAVATPAEYYAALKQAAFDGIPVIIKVGQRGCPPCAAMAPALKEAEESLKGSVVVIRVRADVEETKQLAMDLGADEGVPIVKFARPVPNDTAHQGLDEIIPERHKGFIDGRKAGFSPDKDGPETLEYFVANGLQEWKKRKSSKK